MLRTLITGGAVALCFACSSDAPQVTLDETAKPVARERARVFYSGHSLTDGVPEQILALAPSLSALGKPADFDFEFQSGSGALILARSFGLDPAAPDAGFRFGRNRHGEGMDVVAEWRSPRTLKAGERYDTVVITERHDVPWTIEHDRTVAALAHYVDAFQGANPEGNVLLYHTWLGLNGGPVAEWFDYERDALPLWECIASAVNRKLPAGRPALRVLPGATALVQLVEDLVTGKVPGVSGSDEQHLALIFSDEVHLAPAGLYFMGLVHYAALFGASPEGAAAPDGLSPELAAHMQKLAWRHVAEYAKRARAGAASDMGACHEYATDVMCPRFYQYAKPVGGSLAERARHMKNAFLCGRSTPFVE